MTSQPPEADADLPEQFRIRRDKRARLLAEGRDPYPVAVERTHTLAQVRAAHPDLAIDSATDDVVGIAGRVIFARNSGKLCFATLQDGDGTNLQAMISLDKAGQESLDTWKADVDLGDIVYVHGNVISSRRGELSVLADSWQMAAKSLRPLPVAHKEMSEESRVRQRYVDLIVRPEARAVARQRIAVVRAIRNALDRRGFLEVETPILQPQAGGAIARPFLTHANALDIDLSLRIAPELYLKRLVVGGYERVFEIARNFRNEGVSTRHSPEFTALEAYRAFGDVTDAMDLTEALVVAAARESIGRLTVVFGDAEVDLTPPWPRLQLLDVLEERLGLRVHPTDAVDRLRSVCEQYGVTPLPEWGPGKLVFELYDQVLLPELVAPVFLVGFPVEVSPLARHTADDPTMADRFELCIVGREFANGYSELNIPEEQAARFEVSAAAKARGDAEAHPADQAYVRSLQYGLPPTAGIGIGIDRLIMLLAEVDAIRDVILFPMLRPEAAD